MEWDWIALGTALRDRRKALRLTQEELAELAGVHVGTIKDYERGKSYKRMPKSWIALERVLDWLPGSAKAILEGDEPTIVTGSAGTEPSLVSSEAGLKRSYRREPMPDSDLAALIHNIVFDAIVSTAPDTPASRIREIEERGLELARQAGFGARRPRQSTHTEDKPEL
jgi:transcriptional regulator with XRE-family HTH domain